MKPLLLAAAFVLGSSGALAASTPPDEFAKAIVQRLQHELEARAGEFGKDSEKLYRAVDGILAPHFDLPYITQLILARHWKQATPQQRQRFQEAFKRMLIRSYAGAALEIRSARTVWQSLNPPAGATNVTVQSKVFRENGPPLPIGLSLRRRGDDWKVYDITVENISLVSSFRGQVAAQIRQGGLDAVIQSLERSGPH